MNKILLSLIILLFPITSQARTFKLFEVNEINLEHKIFLPGSRYPLITNNGLGNNLEKELNLNLNIDVLKYGYFNNHIHSMTDISPGANYGQFRLIGWNFHIGIRLTNFLNIEYEHFSQHLLDAQFPYDFPLQNSVNIKLFLYKKEKCKECLINLW